MRTYNELSSPDRSGLPAQIEAQRLKVVQALAGVDRVIAVMSGKGGVGKSYVTANLARALGRAPASGGAGVVDADLNGPTIPGLLGISGSYVSIGRDGIVPLAGLDGVRCMSMGLLLEEGTPLVFRGPAAHTSVWRGTMEAAALREFLGDVAWGRLEVLLIDLPPGVQRYLDICDLLAQPPQILTVTIPTPESRDAVRRAMRAAAERGSEVLGIVENMVGGELRGDAADELAAEFEVPVLARLPWHPAGGSWDDLANRLRRPARTA